MKNKKTKPKKVCLQKQKKQTKLWQEVAGENQGKQQMEIL